MLEIPDLIAVKNDIYVNEYKIKKTEKHTTMIVYSLTAKDKTNNRSRTKYGFLDIFQINKNRCKIETRTIFLSFTITYYILSICNWDMASLSVMYLELLLALFLCLGLGLW